MQRREAGGDERRGAEGETVGAVAVDRHGRLAAATSTGGRCGKLDGRIGDTPIIGAGAAPAKGGGGSSRFTLFW